MPILVTHYYFGREVLAQVTPELAKKVNYDLFDFATTGFDPLAFSYFLFPFAHGRQVRLARHLRTEKIDAYFKKLIELAKYDELLRSYALGAVTHYFLATTVNPYLYYFTGLYSRKNKKATGQYLRLKTRLERAIDCDIIENYLQVASDTFDVERELLKLSALPKELAISFNDLYRQVFHLKDGFYKLWNGLYYQKKFYRLCFDPKGTKTRLLRKLTKPKAGEGLDVYTYFGKKAPDVDIYNLQKAEWQHPVTGEKSTATFWTLFDAALATAVAAVNAIYNYWYQGGDLAFLKKFGNLHYETGLPLAESGEMRFFGNIFASHGLTTAPEPTPPEAPVAPAPEAAGSTSEAETSKVPAPEAAEAEPVPEAEAPEAEAPEVEAPEVEAPEVEAPEVEALEVEALEAATPAPAAEESGAPGQTRPAPINKQRKRKRRRKRN